MPDHADNYIRLVDPDGNEVGVLDELCGHHCGVITVGGATQMVRHCNCSECHEGKLNGATS